MSFKHDVARFLDEFVRKNQNNFDMKKFAREYDQMLTFVHRYFPAGFAKTQGASSTPRVRFEAIAVGVNLALREEPDLVPQSMDWLNSPEFGVQVTTHASNSGPRLRSRVEFVRDRLLGRG